METDCISLNQQGPKPEELYRPIHLFQAPICSQTFLRTITTDIPKDVIRAKESSTHLSQAKANLYTTQPSVIAVPPHFQ